MLYLKPEIWAQRTVGERMERLLGWSLDDCKAILEWEVQPKHHTRHAQHHGQRQDPGDQSGVDDDGQKRRTNRRIEDPPDAIFGKMAEEYRALKAIDGGKKHFSQARK